MKIKELVRKTTKEKNKLPGKLVDCTNKSVEGTELFIVEGDSAGGSAKQARIREKQAILPLKGKILNVQSISLSKTVENTELQNLIQALGCGIGENFQFSKMRYEKIILMTDADVDGSHITTLLITFFYKFMYNTISKGCLYLAMPPLFKISYKNITEYAYSVKEKNNIIKKKFNKNSPLITRFKGLGEMPAELLKKTTMDIKNRKLIKIYIKKDEKNLKKTRVLFESLMGKKAELRFKFIQKNSNLVNVLDI